MLSGLLDQARLLVVTGKGGTGKTTVAGALAIAAARRGRRTLVLEVEGRQGLAALFGRSSLGYRESILADGVMGLAVDPEESLREYLGRYGAAPLTRLLSWARLTRFITAAAPGLGDILLVGKVWEATTRQRAAGGLKERSGSPPERGSGFYDLVVLDAPPTGRIVPFLRAPETVAELARVGPIRHQAERVRELLDDPALTRVVLVCLPEELPVTETLESASLLRAARLPLGPVVANRVSADRLGARGGRLAALARDPGPLADAARQAGAELDGNALALLVGEARDQRRRVEAERRLLRELRAGLPQLPVVELPLLLDGVNGAADVALLAERLTASGPAPRADRVRA
ncbi:MAG TPA: ArsA-related P-loop ATPase [Actinomycetes bacterium]